MANAWCINAYDCNGCLIQTLQNLDSACIGVGVQYTAPNPLDDKRLDYIKYTDKCWCVQCLSAENEILIYATNGVIKNLTLTNDDVNEAIKIKWNDIFWSNRAKTIVRYKTWSYPVSITDGTLAVEETTKNQYSSTPFSLSGVLDETTYYITAFAVDSNNVVIWTQQTTITTDFWWHPSANTLARFPFKDDANDHSWNWVTLVNTQYISKQSLWYKWQFSQWATWNSYSLHFNNSNAKYIWMWYKVLNSTWNSNICWLQKYGAVWYNTSHWNTNLNNKIVLFTNTSWSIWASADWMSFNVWHHIAIWYDWSKVVLSKDWVLSTLYNWTWYNFWVEVWIAWSWNNSNFQVLFSDVICESVSWTQAQITEYWNKTKSIYWR